MHLNVCGFYLCALAAKKLNVFTKLQKRGDFFWPQLKLKLVLKRCQRNTIVSLALCVFKMFLIAEIVSFTRNPSILAALPPEERLLWPWEAWNLRQVLLLRGRKVQHDHLPAGSGLQSQDWHLHLARWGRHHWLQVGGCLRVYLPQGEREHCCDPSALCRSRWLSVLLCLRQWRSSEKERLQAGPGLWRGEGPLWLGSQGAGLVRIPP